IDDDAAALALAAEIAHRARLARHLHMHADDGREGVLGGPAGRRRQRQQQRHKDDRGPQMRAHASSPLEAQRLRLIITTGKAKGAKTVPQISHSTKERPRARATQAVASPQARLRSRSAVTRAQWK